MAPLGAKTLRPKICGTGGTGLEKRGIIKCKSKKKLYH